jgi:hypothetical protein
MNANDHTTRRPIHHTIRLVVRLLIRHADVRPDSRGATRLLRGLAMVAVAAGCAARVQAQVHTEVSSAVPPESVPALEWPDSDVVGELLRQETRAAIAAQEQRRRQTRRESRVGIDPGAVVDAQPDRIDLAAIYGIGKRLDVELLVNGRRLRYRHGRKWPEEAPDGDGAYALRAIQGQCVMLDGAGGNRRVCLANGG